MKTRTLWWSAVLGGAFAAILSACGGTVDSGNGGKGGTTTGGYAGSGGCGDGDGCGGSDPWVLSCFSCACDYLVSEGGCMDVCDKDYNGNPSTPNFCDGVNALPVCAACILNSCGESDPNNCGQ